MLSPPFSSAFSPFAFPSRRSSSSTSSLTWACPKCGKTFSKNSRRSIRRHQQTCLAAGSGPSAQEQAQEGEEEEEVEDDDRPVIAMPSAAAVSATEATEEESGTGDGTSWPGKKR